MTFTDSLPDTFEHEFATNRHYITNAESPPAIDPSLGTNRLERRARMNHAIVPFPVSNLLRVPSPPPSSGSCLSVNLRSSRKTGVPEPAYVEIGETPQHVIVFKLAGRLANPIKEGTRLLLYGATGGSWIAVEENYCQDGMCSLRLENEESDEYLILHAAKECVQMETHLQRMVRMIKQKWAATFEQDPVGTMRPVSPDSW